MVFFWSCNIIYKGKMAGEVVNHGRGGQTVVHIDSCARADFMELCKLCHSHNRSSFPDPQTKEDVVMALIARDVG